MDVRGPMRKKSLGYGGAAAVVGAAGLAVEQSNRTAINDHFAPVRAKIDALQSKILYPRHELESLRDEIASTEGIEGVADIIDTIPHPVTNDNWNSASQTLMTASLAVRDAYDVRHAEHREKVGGAALGLTLVIGYLLYKALKH
jgi:hypothetical protein